MEVHEIDVDITTKSAPSTLREKATVALRSLGARFSNGLRAVVQFLCAFAYIALHMSAAMSPLLFIGFVFIIAGGWDIGFPMVALSVCVIFFGSVLYVVVNLCT